MDSNLVFQFCEKNATISSLKMDEMHTKCRAKKEVIYILNEKLILAPETLENRNNTILTK